MTVCIRLRQCIGVGARRYCRSRSARFQIKAPPHPTLSPGGKACRRRGRHAPPSRSAFTLRLHAPPSPFTLHPSPFTLHPSPFTLHPSPFTLHLSPFTFRLVTTLTHRRNGIFILFA